MDRLNNALYGFTMPSPFSSEEAQGSPDNEQDAEKDASADGSVTIPEVLWNYMGGTKVLVPKK